MRITIRNLLDQLAHYSPECQVLITNEHHEEFDSFHVVAVSPDTVARIEFFSDDTSKDSKLVEFETKLGDADKQIEDWKKQLESAEYDLSRVEEKLAKIGELL